MSKNQKHCYIEDCTAEPVVVCSCEKKPILICKTHGIDHCEITGRHHYDKIYTEIHEETRKAVLKQFYKIKYDIKLFRSKVIQEELSLISEIQKVSQKALKDLKIQEQKLNQYIFKILSLKEIDNSTDSSFIESLLKIPPNELPTTQFFKSLELHVNHISSDSILQLFDLEELSEENTTLDSSVYEMKYIWSYSSTTLNIFNTKTLKEEKICLQMPTGEGLDQYGAKCLLPDGSLFYDNGPITIIIDSKYHIKTLPKYQQQSLNACAVYKDREIYLIGGVYDHSAKFSLSKNKWARLINMPISLSSYTFGAIFKNYILLGSMSSDRILYYDTEEDSYSQILSINLTSACSKAFFVKNETVYLIEFSQYIYMSTDHLATWVNVGSSSVLTGNAPLISTPVFCNQKVYFANYYGIYSFDLRQQEIEKIKSLIDH